MTKPIDRAVQTATEALRHLEAAISVTQSADRLLQFRDAERDLDSAIRYMTEVPSEGHLRDVPSDAGEGPASRKFGDVQMAVTEVIALVGCIYHADFHVKRGDDSAPDIPAAMEGVRRMLERISNDLCDLEGNIAG